LALGLLVFLGIYAWPRLSARYISPPPDVYLAICTRDAPAAVVISVRDASVKRRSSHITVGGDKKKAAIYVSGLRPVEFTIEVRGDKVLLVDASKGDTRAVFRHLSAEKVATSNPGIRLYVAAKRNALDGVSF
jgi:hypothetical protein